MGALTKLNISNNSIKPEGAKVLAEALKGNQVMAELNISCNKMTDDGNYGTDMSGVIALTDVIPGMGALSSFTYGDKQVLTMATEITEANFSGELLCPYFPYEA
jgi:hypothetical protein